MKTLRCSSLIAAAAMLLLALAAMPPAFARGGSFGGGGRSFGGGSFGGGRSFGGGGGFFGGGSPRPSFTPAPRPSFTPAPAPMPSPATSGSFGRGGGIGNPTSNRFSTATGGGGSFGRTGATGTRSFTSTSSHPNAMPGSFGGSPGYPSASTHFVGSPYVASYYHPYYYGGRPVNVFFTGGFNDYSYGYYGHPYYGYFPWTPVFYTNPPMYMNGGYVSGGFSWLHLLLGIIFWLVIIGIIIRIVNSFRNRPNY